MRAPFIVVAGNIGAGKSTLTERLAGVLSYKAHFEDFQANPFLERYYEDMARWALPSQLFFLSSAIAQHRRILAGRRGAVQDRSVYEHFEVFARDLHGQGLLDDDEFATLEGLYGSVRDLLAPPDLLVYVDVPAAEARRRVAARGRGMESDIPLHYLEHLDARYRRWIGEWDGSPVLRVDGERYDVREPEDLDRVCDMVLACLPGAVRVGADADAISDRTTVRRQGTRPARRLGLLGHVRVADDEEGSPYFADSGGLPVASDDVPGIAWDDPQPEGRPGP